MGAALLLVAGLLAFLPVEARQGPPHRLEDTVKKLTLGYLSNEELIQYLKEFSQRCSAISKLHRLGQSVDGVPLLALEISDQPGVDTAKPQVRYAANIHGDEPSGRQLLLLLAETLCAEHKQEGSPERRLVSSVRLFLLPTLNPDGYAMHRRENKAGVDLNRNFPDPVHQKGEDLRQPTGKEQPETLAVMNFTLAHRFVASLALHEGAMVANYPYDGYDDGSQAIRKAKHAAPDDPTFMFMAAAYANLHTTMADNNPEFPGGITNGAQWYPLYGGLQDWSYLAANCLEVTLELNNDKSPHPDRLAQMWTENAQALVLWPLKTVLAGLRGRVVHHTQPDNKAVAVAATIHIEEDGATFPANPRNGFFARVLAPGQYTVSVQAPGFKPAKSVIKVPEDGSGVEWVCQLRPEGQAEEQQQQQPQHEQQPQHKEAEPGGKGSGSGQPSQQQDGPHQVADGRAHSSEASTASPAAVWLLVLGAPLAMLAIFYLWKRKHDGQGSLFPRPAGYQPVVSKLRPAAGGEA